jgi:hypothetical protein
MRELLRRQFLLGKTDRISGIGRMGIWHAIVAEEVFAIWILSATLVKIDFY